MPRRREKVSDADAILIAMEDHRPHWQIAADYSISKSYVGKIKRCARVSILPPAQTGCLTEQWKPIRGYEGQYSISLSGKVWSHKRNRLLSTRVNRKGYPTVRLSAQDKESTATIHRLVAEAYLPNPKNLPIVNHLDFNRANFSLTNLEWTDVRGNYHHSKAHGRIPGPPRRRPKACKSKVAGP